MGTPDAVGACDGRQRAVDDIVPGLRHPGPVSASEAARLQVRQLQIRVRILGLRSRSASSTRVASSR